MKRNLLIILLSILLSTVVLYAQTPEELRAKLPKIDGWEISEHVDVFGPNNLFDRINGAAPLFIENNFRELTSLDYLQGDEYITIQAYRHATPEDAFGMYASERSSGLTYYPIGGESQGDDQNLFFFAGNIYVKMWSSSSIKVPEVLQKIADGFAKNIDPRAAYPSVVQAFSDQGKEPYTAAYITANYIGHEFLKSVYVSEYKSGEKKFQLFVVDAKTPEAAKEVLNSYFTFTRQPLDFTPGKMTIKDRYNGDIPALWQGQYIIGVFSASGAMILEAETLIEETAENLAKI